MKRPRLIPDKNKLLATRLSELPLDDDCALQQSLTDRLHAELKAKGIDYPPRVYLSDEWGCPNGQPIIGIPFYLANSDLCRLVGETSGCPVEDEEEMMLYLRHEAGHAFNYAYQVDKEPAWQKIFGNPAKPYPFRYRTRPFSPGYVRHIPGWYAQKHPDEDFAESFAVWLTPHSDWQERYAGTPALEKILYVADAVRRLGNKKPTVTTITPHLPIGEFKGTLSGWCRERGRVSGAGVDLPGILEGDLRDLLPAREGRPAKEILEKIRPQLLCQVRAWTGLDSGLLFALMLKLGELMKNLDLRVEAGEQDDAALKMTVFITTLAMNFQKTGRFTEG